MRTYRPIRSTVAVLALLLPICAWANVYRFHDAVLDNGATVTGEFNVTESGTINSWLVQAWFYTFKPIPIFCHVNPVGCDPPFSLATIVSPNHVSFDYQSTPSQSHSLDIFLAGPLNPGDDQITTLSVLSDRDNGTHHIISGVLTGPEPQTWVAFGLGLLLFGSVRVFRKA